MFLYIYVVMVVAAIWCGIALLAALGWHLLRAVVQSRSDDSTRGIAGGIHDRDDH